MAEFSCPIGPEFDALVKEFNSKAAAMAAVTLNKGVIPSIDEAHALINGAPVLEKDAKLSKSSDEFVYNKVLEERKVLEKLKLSATTKAQKQAIDKLLTANYYFYMALKDAIDNNISLERNSVTNLIGSNFTGDAKEYEKTKRFGIFIHDFADKVVKTANEQGTRVSDIAFDKNFFLTELSKFYEKNYFSIENLDDDALFEMSKDLIEKIAYLKGTEHIVIPEVSVIGKTRTNEFILGRIDLLVLDVHGNFKIYDFKTKKVSHLITDEQKDELGVVNKVDNVTRALLHMGSKNLPTLSDPELIKQKKASVPILRASNYMRTTYDTWTLQLQVYENILKQSGLEKADDSVIVSLLYEMDEKNTSMLGRAIHVFDKEDYYSYANSIVQGSKTKPGQQQAKLLRLRKAIELEIPTGEVVDEALEQKDAKILEFTPTAEEDKLLIEAINRNFEAQIKEVSSKIKSLKDTGGNAVLLRVYEEQLKTLLGFKSIYNQTDSVSEMRLMHNFHLVHEIVSGEITENLKTATAAIEKFRADSKPSNFLKQSEIIRSIYKRTKSLDEVINVLNDVVRLAMLNPENKLTQDSNIVKSINALKTNIEIINSMFSEISLEGSIQLLSSVGTKTFSRVTELTQEPIDLEIRNLEKQIEDLKNGKEAGFFKKFKGATLSLISKNYREEVKKMSTEPQVAAMEAIENLEFKILKLKGLKNMKYDEASLRQYVNAVTDPASPLYVGAQNTLQQEGLINNMMLDHMIASAGNSDLTIAAFTQFLKNVKFDAVQNVQKDFAVMNFDKLKNDLLKVYNVNQLNDMISEKRKSTYFNYDNNQEEETEKIYFVKPTSEAYDRIYKNFSNKYFILNKELRELKYAFKTIKPGTEEHAAAEKAYFEKVEERNAFNEKHLQWLVDHTSLPYKDEFYELQQALPFEIRNELQKKYHEIEIIKASLEVSSEEFLSDEDTDRIDEILYEIRVLKQQAKELNPEYADLITRFNNLYKFSEDTKRFELAYQNAKIKYENEDPEKWKKWLDKNTIVKPKDIWYQELSSLYDAKASIMSFYYGEDNLMSELLDRKRILLAPHKVNGKLQIKNMDDLTIEELDTIHAAIDDIINTPKPKVKMDEEDRKLIDELNAEIDRITNTELSENYQDIFKSKSKALTSKHDNYIDASVNVKLATTEEERVNLEQIYLKAEQEFFLYEEEFKNWYNKFHKNKYLSIRDNEAYFINNATPKEFNYQRVVNPDVYETYMEEKPSPKYRVKTLRPDEYVNNETGEALSDEELENISEEELAANYTFVEGVYNKDFLKATDGIPMPKNIQKVGNAYVLRPGMENMTITDPETGETHPAVNPKYLDLLSKPEVFNFYNELMDMYFKLQNKIDGRRSGYVVPGYAASTAENLSRYGLSDTIKKGIDIYIDKELKTVGSAQDYNDNTYGVLGDVKKLSGARQLPLNLQTTDSIGALMNYAVEAHYNIALKDAAPVADMTIEYLESMSETIQSKIQAKDFTYIDPISGKKAEVNWDKRFKELNKVIEILKFERRKFVNGQATNPEERNKKLSKIVRQIMNYTSFVRMGFDVVNQTKNYVSGNVQAFIAAGGLDDSSHYTKENYAWAKKEIYTTFLKNYFADWGKVNDVSASTMLYRKFNPLQKEFDKYVQDVSGTTGRRKLGKFANLKEIGYMLQDKGDTEVGLTVMYSVLDNYRYKTFTYGPDGTKQYITDANGNFVTVKAHEVYEQGPDKLLKIRSDVEFDAEDEKFLRNIIYSEIRRAQGNYASWDQTKFEENIVGKLVFYYRKYIVPQFLNRFGYLRPNWEGSEVTIGYWRVLSKLFNAYGFKDAMAYFFAGTYGSKRISPAAIGKVYTKGINHARRDSIAMAIATLLGYAALQYVKRKDDDDEELGFLDGNAVRLVWGVQGETTAMFPVGGGSQEYIRNFTTATTYLRELTAAKKLISHSLYTGMALTMGGGEEPDDYDSELYQEVWKEAYYNKKSGAYEKGDLKLGKDLIDLTGFKNFRDVADPNYRIDILKRNR